MRFCGGSQRAEVFRGRRLFFETLERRDLLAVIRLVDWNTLNGPNDPAGDANFHTIFDAIGNETVQGNTKRLDILALQETDPAGSGGNSIGRIESILDALYPSTDYASVISLEDGGGDSTGFVYDTSTLSLLESIEVSPGSLTHRILRGKFRPSATLGESDFYVYSIHLKAGSAASDETTRGLEATVLRGDADSLGEGAFVLFVGDFNMKDSFEAAYTNLVTAGAGQVQDVADAPGSWFNNPAFKSLHTQNPQIAMDDRFDLQFASGEFFDGVDLEYIPNSFHVFGNNGTHTFDAAITTGTGASPAVLSALASVSDHLPIIADYEILVSTPGVRITETGGMTKVIEGGLYDTYSVVLDTTPTTNVSVSVIPDSQVDVGNGAGVAKVLTFTPANALTPQTVVVQAADDLAGEGNHTGLVTHTSASADPEYDALSIAGVNVSIVDNDAPTIVINEIDSDTAGTDMLEFVELYDGGVGNASLSGKTVVFFNGANDQSYAAFDLTGYSTDANGFFVLGNAGVSGVDLVFANNTLQNGQDAVALYAAAASAFPNGTAVNTTNLLDAVVYGTSDPDDAGLQVLLAAGQPQLNENSGGNGTGHSLSRVPDGGEPRVTETYVPRDPTPGALNQPQTPGVLIVHSGTRVDVAEGGVTDSYQLALQSIPTADVTITVDPDSQTDLGAGAGVAIVLVFTPSNALIPQTVTVAAVDDAAVEGVHTSVITHAASSADGAYNGIAIGNIVANIVDNDASAPTSIVISEIMYNPASDESAPGVAEWNELINRGTTAVDLGGWLFDDEDATNWGAIPAGTILNPGQIAVFFDAAFTSAAVFRAEWSVPETALVVGISWANLANTPSSTNEVLQLLNNGGVQMDLVNYDDASPWPAGMDGPSIYLKGLALDNSDGSNWARSTVGIAGAISPSGTIFLSSDVGSPGRFFLPGDYNVNGSVDAADYVLWRKTLGTSNPQADGSGPSTGVPDGVVDQLDYDFWAANFGAVGVTSGVSGAGAGDEAAATALSDSVVTASSESLAAADNVLAADGAVIDLALSGLPLKPSTTDKPVLPLRRLYNPVTSEELLLLLSQSSLVTRDAVDSPAVLCEALNEDFDEIDLFFDLLDEGRLAESVAWVPR